MMIKKLEQWFFDLLTKTSLRPVHGIHRDTLDFAFSVAEDEHPHEFIGILELAPVDELDISLEEGSVIKYINFPPGAKSSQTTAMFNEAYMPLSSRYVGTIHSHPNGNTRPSNQDLQTFSGNEINIIVGYPYDESSWTAYNPSGNEINLKVI